MRRLAPWLLIPVLSLAAIPLSAQQTLPDSSSPIITVSANGEVKAVPDRGHLVLSVQTRSGSAAVAAEENAAKQTAVIAALRSFGLTASQISTRTYTITPETRNDTGTRTPRVVSYLVSNSLQVEISDLAMIGKIIDSSLSHGASQVSSINFFESNADALYRDALTSAVINAKAEATVMAAAAGGRLGRLLEMSSYGARTQTPLFENVRMAAFSPAETPILPGQNTIQASVTAKWGFLPNK